MRNKKLWFEPSLENVLITKAFCDDKRKSFKQQWGGKNF